MERLKDASGADDDKYVIFKQDDLFGESFPRKYLRSNI